MLFAVVLLPIRLLLIVGLPAGTWTPATLAEIEVVEPLAVMEPMALFEIFTALGLESLIPTVRAAVVDVVVVIEPVPVPAPMVLPVTLPRCSPAVR